ncbi:MMS19 nucleotide excision repair protein homolog isoform X2 [Xenia sp. Carnegie-2017]|nr:MMS19 nucleotide excision repair protein homolog isoform X2 [Xenia sp. Carnegie-2017]
MLFTVLLEKKMSELQTLGTDFVFGYIQAMDGEKDPRNLLVCFELVQIIVKRFPIDHLAEDLFEVTSCYFPIDFTPPPNDPHSITREQLILALRKCLASTSIFAPFCVPLLIEKISSDVIYAKKDALLTLASCANVYDARFISEQVPSLWNHIKQEIFMAAEQSVEAACLEAIRSIMRNIALAEELNHGGTLNNILTKMLSDIKGNFLKQDQKILKTSASILQNASMASDVICGKVLDEVIPIFLEQFEMVKQVSHQKSILDAMLGFLQVAKEFEGKDSLNCLMKFKENLLGLFFSLLVNQNPLHRSSGIAGLVAMTASGILVEDELVSFLGHLLAIMLQDDEKIVRHETKLALAYLSSRYSFLVRRHVIGNLVDRLSAIDDLPIPNGMNKVPISSCVTHEDLIDTLTIFCTEQENIECILPCLVDNLTKLCKDENSVHETSIGRLIDCLIGILEDSLKKSFNVLDYYKDVVFLRVLKLAVTNSLANEEFVFASTVLETFSKLLRIISSKLPERCCNDIISIVFEVLVDAKFDKIDEAFDHDMLNMLDTSSPWQRTQLVILLKSVLCNVPKKIMHPRTPELYSRLLNVTVECRHRLTNVEASKCLAGLINRIQDENEVDVEVGKCLEKLDPLLEKDRTEDEKWRATISLIWISKALLIRGHNLGLKLVDKLLKLFDDQVIGQCAADGFYVVMLDSDDVMVNASYANMKLMYKQRIFVQVSPLLTNLFHSSRKETKHLYLCALSHIMNGLPKQVLLSEIPTLFPLLVQSLSCDESSIQLSTLKTFYSLTHELPTVLSQYVTSLVPRYLHLARNAPSLQMRSMSLKCLGVLTVLPYHELYPYKNQIIKSLSKCLDDPKRLVRKEAVLCRNEWFLLGTND